MASSPSPAWSVRRRIGEAMFARVAGPNGHDARSRVHDTPGERWFPRGAAIREVHGDASMWVGGLRALLLQSLHPLAMAGVAGHSGYRGDPWGRLERTSTFLAYTTFGAADDAQATVDRIRARHETVRGKAADGTPYRASDPRLLTWVHVAEVDSFLRAYQAFGSRPLPDERADDYVAQAARIAIALGAKDVPTSVAELEATIAGYRPELAVSDAARDTARFLLKEPPLPLAARPGYGLIAAGAVSLLPDWAQRELGVGGWLTRSVGRASGAAATRAVRWGLSGALPNYPTR